MFSIDQIFNFTKTLMLNSSRSRSEANFAKRRNTQKRLLAEVKIEAKARKRFNQYLLFCDSVFRREILLALKQDRRKEERTVNEKIGQNRHVNGYKNVAVYNLLSVDQMVHVLQLHPNGKKIFFSLVHSRDNDLSSRWLFMVKMKIFIL